MVSFDSAETIAAENSHIPEAISRRSSRTVQGFLSWHRYLPQASGIPAEEIHEFTTATKQ